MFRRKEDEATDTATSTTGSDSSATESATVISPQSSSPYGSSSAASASPASSAPVSPYSGSAYSPAGTAPGAIRPGDTSAPRAAASPFRASGAQADAQRGRPADNKVTAAASATGNANSKDNRRVLTVGADILLKGEIATCDRLVIEGKVDATLNDVHTVEIAEAGSFKGTAQVEYAEISGLFEGELTVKNRLVIYATGRVRGKITYGEIEIERGGELTGEISTIGSESSAQSQPTYNRRERVAA